MEKNRFIKTALCLVLAFAMTFAPIFSSYAVIATALAGEVQATESQEPAAGDKAAPSDEGTVAEDPQSGGENETAAPSEEAATEKPSAEEGTVTAPSEGPMEEADSAEEEAAEEVKATKTEYVWKDDKVIVTAVLSDAEAIPDDAELIATAIDKDSEDYNYDAYMKALNDSSESSYTEKNTLLYDIAFIKDGVELQPESGKVSVRFEFLDKQLADSIGAKKAADVNVIHLPLTDDVKEQYDTTADAKDIKAEDINVEALTPADNDLKVSVKNEKVVFKTDSFSVFAYTVDFEYNGYQFSIPGGTTIKLSEVFEQLNIDKDIKDVEKVTFSNPELVEVKEPSLFNSEWRLESKKAFSTEETLTVEMIGGENIIINVTDSQSALEVSISLYDYSDTNTLAFPSAFGEVDGEADHIFLFAWVGGSNVQALGENDPWTCIPMDDIRGKSSPYKVDIASFSTNQWYNANNKSYASLTDAEKEGIRVRIIHTSDANAPTLGSIKSMSVGSYEELWNGGFDGYPITTAHGTGLQPGGNYSVNFKQGDKHEHDVVLKFADGVDPAAIPEGSYIMLEALSADGSNRYYYVVPAVMDGYTDKVVIPVTGHWSQNQPFSSNWQKIIPHVITPKDGQQISTGGNKPADNSYNTVYTIGDYAYTYSTTEERDSSDEHLIHSEFVFELKPANFKDAIDPYDVLGEGAEFGVVASTYIQRDHTETNFAAKRYENPNYKNIEIDGSGDGDMPFYAGEIIEHVWFSGANNVNLDIYVSEEYSSISRGHQGANVPERIHDTTPDTIDVKVIPMSQAAVNAKVDELINTLKASSNRMKEEHSYHVTFSSNRTVDTTSFPDGKTIYIDASDLDFGSGGWTLKKLPGQTIVFNIPGTAPVTIREFHVIEVDSNGTQIRDVSSNSGGNGGYSQDLEEAILDHVVFNAYETELLKPESGPAGLFLVPNGNVKEESGSGTGWVATGGTFDQVGAEWHFFRTKRYYNAKGDFTLSGKKRIVDSAGKALDYSQFNSMDFAFELYECDEDGNITNNEYIERKTANKTTGNFDFSKLDFDETTVSQDSEVVFYYLVKEVIPSEDSDQGVAYNAVPLIVKVVAHDDPSDETHGDITFTISVKHKDSEEDWTTVTGEGDDHKIYEIGNFDNTYEEQAKGSLKISKHVTVNGNDTETSLADGRYTFTVTKKEDDSFAPVTVVFTITDGAVSSATVNGENAELDSEKCVTLTDLEAGTYVIEEAQPTNGTHPVQANPYEVEVTAGSESNPAKFAFTNDYETVSAQVEKVWEGNNDLPESLTVVLYADDNATNNVVTLDENNQWKSDVITNLPKYRYDSDLNQNVEINYHWVEGVVPNGWFLTGSSKSGILTTLTNTYQEFGLTTSYIGTKTWQDIEADKIPHALTVELYQDGVKMNPQPEMEWTKNGNVWTYEFKHLPVFKPDGSGVHEYYAVETLSEGYSKAQDDEITPTDYHQGEATLLDDMITTCAETEIDIQLNSKTDLAWAIVKLTHGSGYLIWTHRVPLPSEKQSILDAGSEMYSGSFNKNKYYVSGHEGSFDTYAGRITVSYDDTNRTIHIHFPGESAWATLGYGNFGEDVEYEPGSTAFFNTYGASGEGEIKVQKVLNGRQWKTDDSFTFTLAGVSAPTGVDSVPMPVDADGNVVDSITITNGDADHTKSFGTIPFTKEGTYTYTVTETAGASDKGLTYDTSPKTVTFVVEDDGNGHLVATEGSQLVQLTTVTNEYAAEGEGEIEVQKVLEGRDWTTDDSFTFTLVPDEGSPEPEGFSPVVGYSSITITNADADHKKKFGKITFTSAGTYTYTVTETAGASDKGLSYDTEPRTVTFVVEDDGNGHLVAAEGSQLVQLTTVTNEYAAEGEGEIKVQKVLDGRQWKTDDSFTFTLAGVSAPTGVNTVPMPVDADGNVVDSITITNGDADHTKSFGMIPFTKEGTYTYTVSETAGAADKGLTYDTSPKTVTFVVEDDGNGHLVATEGSQLVQLTTVTNEYAAEGEGEIEVQKVLDGRQWKTDDSFTFTLAGVSAPTGVDLVPMPVDADGNVVDSITITNDDADHTKSFGTIPFTKEGTYTYTVTETAGAADKGLTYDTSPKTVTFVVEDDGNGHLVAAEGSQLVQLTTVTNEYAAEGEGEIKVQKVLDGRQWKTDDSFTFTLAGVSAPTGVNPVPMPVDADGNVVDSITITNDDADHTKSFGTIPFTKEGTYTYRVTEIAGAADKGMTYDTTAHEVTITVVDDNNGHLIAEDGDSLIKRVTVTNEYGVSGSGEIRVQKLLDGRQWKTDDSFTFTLEGVSAPEGITTVPMPVNEDGSTVSSITITNSDADHTKSFGTIPFTKAGTYTYRVTETAGDANKGLSYDTDPRTVTFVVEDDGNGHLIAAEGSSLLQAVTVTNEYAASGEGEIEVQKLLEGRDWTTDDSFTFTLVPDEGSPKPEGFSPVVGYSSITITNADADHKKKFGKITFTSAGTYTYTVTETAGASDKGLSYDTEPRTVTFIVEDDGNGHLIAAEGSSLLQAVTVTNEYAASGEGEIKVQKVLEGRDWTTDDSFTFTLEGVSAPTGVTTVPMPVDEDGSTVSSITITNSDADHTKSFGTIPFTKEGTYTYTVSETAGDANKGLSYDTEPRTVTFVVEDDGNGHLIAAEGSQLVQLTTVTNEYAASGSIKLDGTKTLEGKTLTKDAFNFKISAAKGSQSPLRKANGQPYTDEELTVANKADGTFEFPELWFNLDDLRNTLGVRLQSKTFEYNVTEVLPNGVNKEDLTIVGDRGYDEKTGIIYDLSVKTVKLTVSDKGDGTLEIVKAEGTDELSFVNENRFTELKLTKSLDSLVKQDTEGELVDVTLVFKIRYFDSFLQKNINRNISVKFDADKVAAQTVTVDKIPTDLEARDISVDEVYSADYTGTLGEVSKDNNSDGTPVFSVTAENRKKGDVTGGGLINVIDPKADGARNQDGSYNYKLKNSTAPKAELPN